MTQDLFSESETPVVASTEVDVNAVLTKFGDDKTAIAKAKAEADRHIANIEKENAEMRQALKQSATFEQLMDEIRSSKTPSSNSQDNSPEQNEETQLDKDTVKRMLREELAQERSQAQTEANLTKVRETLQKAWGASYLTKLKDKAAENGMTVQQVNALAASSPTAFLKLVDANVTQSPVPNTAPPTNQRTQDNRNAGVRNKAYYDQIRKEDKSRYWSIPVQRQMHLDAQALGDDFDPSN